MSPEYKAYLALHKRLLDLIRTAEAGTDGEYVNTQEMDDLRDEMDAPWYAMTSEDHSEFENYLRIT